MSESDNVILLSEAGLLALGWMVGARGDISDPIVVNMAKALYETGTKDCKYVNEILRVYEKKNPEQAPKANP